MRELKLFKSSRSSAKALLKERCLAGYPANGVALRAPVIDVAQNATLAGNAFC